MEENVQMAFMLTILAGLATGIGSVIAFFVKERSTKIQGCIFAESVWLW